jgi:hypothetical protein
LFPEIQKRFPSVADAFFNYSLFNLKNILYCKLTKSAEILGIKKPVECYDPLFRKPEDEKVVVEPKFDPTAPLKQLLASMGAKKFKAKAN